MKQRESVQSAIVRTLLYANIFSSGMTLEHVERLLISPRRFSGSTIARAIVTMQHRGTLFQSGNFVWIGGKSRLSTLRSRYAESERKQVYAMRWLSCIVWFPTIRGIALTGSAAVGNARPNEDIDLMIVTRVGSVWMTRLCVEIFFFMCGVLRTKQTRDLRNRFCLNLWIDESSLSFGRRSLYVARELVQAVWLVDKAALQSRILAANQWARVYVANAFAGVPKEPENQQPPEMRVGWLEQSAFRLQTMHMRHRTREVVSLHVAFFHPRDTQNAVTEAYVRFCQRFHINSLVRK